MYCIICGKKIEKPIHISVYRGCPVVPICDSENCIRQYKTLRREWYPKNKNKNKNLEIDTFEGFCKYCGEPLIITPRRADLYRHYYCSPFGTKPPRKKEIKTPAKHPLKPWQDPESLFCDTEFLRELIGQEPAKGENVKILTLNCFIDL